MKSPLEYFPVDYVEARSRFREAVERLGWAIEVYSIGRTGPGGEDLTVDVAISPGEVGSTLVVDSGLHGVEGFFGSAIQTAMLNRMSDHPPKVRCVFIHAINPYGFAWLRRCDADNIDPNRNFLLPGESYSGSPEGYRRLKTLLNPRKPPSRWDAWPIRAIWNILRYGMPTLREAIAAGQYDDSECLFYGGSGPCFAHRLLAEHLGRWLSDARRVVHIDFHSGLGDYGACKLLIDYLLTPNLTAILDRWFGSDSYEASTKEGIAYTNRGGMGHWCVNREYAETYLFLCAEFGTYPGLTVMTALRSENQAHHWGRPDDASTRRAKERLRDVFHPADEEWRTAVLNRGLQLIQQALDYLHSPMDIGLGEN